MLKKIISYTDFNDKSVQKTCYFHLSKSELMEMEMSREGGLQEYLKRIVASEDGKAIMEEFKALILKAYGKRSEDGSGFIKNGTLREEFYSSVAYDTLFMELCTNADKAVEFVTGIVPANLEAEIAKLSTNAGDEAKRVRDLTPQNVFENEETQIRILTPEDFHNMDAEELRAGLASGKFRTP